jgi:hypothetical protein
MSYSLNSYLPSNFAVPSAEEMMRAAGVETLQELVWKLKANDLD